MNIAITGNPYEGENVTVITKGVTVDAKVAKLNNTTKRPVLVHNWEAGRPSLENSKPISTNQEEISRDYNGLMESIGITAVNYTQEANNSGAKKLRVNEIVNTKASTIYNSVNKVDVGETKEVQEVKDLINQISVVEAPQEALATETKREDVHGRHERTGEVPVDEVKEAVKNDFYSNVSSRMAKNALEHENISKNTDSYRQDPKAGDMDLYNNLLHGEKEDDVSRQLQGARQELSFEKEESKKLVEQYGKAVRELEELKEDIENKKRMKAEQEKRELTETLNNIETLKRENLERTSDLSSIQAEIARLKAEKQAMESTMFEENRSFGRRAA